MSRLRLPSEIAGVTVNAEIETAVATTLSGGFGGGSCLCHGDAGNLQLLIDAAVRCDRPEWKTAAHRIAANLLNASEQRGWICGTPGNIETPGLMLGLAGVGYSLLRLARPSIPSLLMLERPPS
jgi:lantibiotic modifying enzyme